MKSQQKINNGIRILFLGAAVALAFTACESPVAPEPYVPNDLPLSVLGTWTHDDGAGMVNYIQFAGDGTVALWSQEIRRHQRVNIRVFYGWEFMPTDEGDDDVDISVEGLGVLRYGHANDVIRDETGEAYRRSPPPSTGGRPEKKT
jgi:hypothetical protein